MWSGSAIPGHSTEFNGKIGSSNRRFPPGRRWWAADGRAAASGEQSRETNSRRAGRRLAFWLEAGGVPATAQWAQARAWPESSAVRKLEPQPQAATAFGLFTVKPAP